MVLPNALKLHPVIQAHPGHHQGFTPLTLTNAVTYLLLVALCWAALLSLCMGAWRAIQSGGSQDFQYSIARLILHGVNPYADWLKGDKSHFLLNQDPLYLPNLSYLLSPFAVLDWPTAKCLWMVVNLTLACYAAWLLYAAYNRQGKTNCGLLIALLFLSSNPVRVAIGNGQQALLILVATVWALRHRSSPLLSGMAFSVSLAKYSIGPFFLAAELGCRRIIAILVVVAIVLAAFVGLSIQTHSPFNLSLLLGPLEVSKLYPSFSNHFLWLNQHFGFSGIRLLSLIGLAVVCLRARALASAGLPAKEVDMKLACGATFASLLFAPHLGYDFLMLALPLALGCRLDQLKKLERCLYIAVLLFWWNIGSFLSALRLPVVITTGATVLMILAFVLLVYAFLAKASNQINTAEDNVIQSAL
jgi:hypothetical protein